MSLKCVLSSSLSLGAGFHNNQVILSTPCLIQDDRKPIAKTCSIAIVLMAGSSLPATRTYASPQSVVCLVFFLLASFITIRPVTIPTRLPTFVSSLLYSLRLRDDKKPFQRQKHYFNIDLNIGPLLAVLILLASKCIGITEVGAGIKGVGDVRPYDILLLFVSLVYQVKSYSIRVMTGQNRHILRSL